MAKFLAICLSSTIQKTISFERVELKHVNRSTHYRLDASGKAINSARILEQLKSQSENAYTTVIIGFNTKAELFYEEEFKALGVNVVVATADGSAGVKGFVTDAIREAKVEFDYLYTCGPLPMLKALYDATDVPAEFSFEERMGCGFGAHRLLSITQIYRC